MADDTEILTKPAPAKERLVYHESTLLGVSIRGWIAVMCAATLCLQVVAVAIISIQLNQAPPPVDAGIMALFGGVFGYYFQKSTSQPNTNTTK